jgi:hypothetical protein
MSQLEMLSRRLSSIRGTAEALGGHQDLSW